MIPRQQNFVSIPNVYAGINRLDAPNSLPINQALELSNFSFGDSNMLEVICGYAVSTTISETEGRGIDAILRYDDGSGPYNLAVYDGSMYECIGDDNPTRLANIPFGIGGRGSWAIYDEVAYLITSRDRQNDYQVAYRGKGWADGNKLRRTGIPTPTDGATTIATATGGDLPAGIYKVLWTLELSDGGIICEGNPNATPVSVTVTGEQTDKITVSITAPDPTDIYTTLNCYITDCNGSDFYFFDSKALATDGVGGKGSTGTFTFVVSAYADLGILDDNKLVFDNYSPPRGSTNCIYNNHMFIAGVEAHPTYVYVGKFSRYEAFPGNEANGNPVSSAYIIDCEDRVVDLRPAKNGALLVLCENSVQQISGYSVDNFSRLILSRSAGCASAGSVASSPEGLIYWRGWDEIYMSEGSACAGVGRYIMPIIKNMTEAQCERSRGYFWDHRYWYSYSTTGDSNDRTLEFDTKYPITNSSGNLILPGAWLGEHTFGVGCFARSRKEGRQRAFFGDPNKGIVYEWNMGNDFAGTIIESRAKSGYLYLDAPLITKRFLSLNVDVYPTTASPIANVTCDYNRFTETFSIRTSRTGYTRFQELGEESGSLDDKYAERSDNPEYGTARYAARFFETSKHRFSQNAQGDNAQIEFFCRNALSTTIGGVTTEIPDRSFAIRNIGISFSAMRRFRG